MIYIGFIGIVSLTAFFLTNKRQSLILMLMLFFIFVAFSFPSGGDWIGYFNNYDCLVNAKCASDFTMFEPGYELLVKIFGGLGFQVVVVVIALINVFLLGKFSNQFDRPGIVILFFICVFLWSLYMEAIRQSVAISLLLIGLLWLFKGNIKKFFLSVLLASFFHITALVCLIFLLPYFSKKISTIVSYSLIIFSVIFMIIPITILEFIIKFLPQTSMYAMKLNFYLLSDEYSPKNSMGIGTILDVLLIGLIVYSLCKVNKYKLFISFNFNQIVFLGVALYIAFAIMVGKVMPVMTRIGWYGFPLVLILLYVNIGNSKFYTGISVFEKKYISRYLIFIYFLLQTLRPLTYPYNNYSIMHQETIFQKIYNLDDSSLRIEASKKCLELTRIGYGYLCDN